MSIAVSEPSPSTVAARISLERLVAPRFAAVAMAQSAASAVRAIVIGAAASARLPSAPQLSVGNAAFLFLLCMSGAALADDAALLRCRGIADASARLACYDALVLPPTEGSAGAASQGKLPAQTGLRASSQTLPQQATEEFGMERRASKSTLDTIESHIPGSFEGWNPKTKIVLANGQVWQISDDSARAHYIDNPKVTIRRGALGAFYLEIEGTNSSPRVRRLQ
jgi:hypothetical protein